MAISNDEFKAALGRFPSGVTVVTTKDMGNKLHGLTVSAFCSVSLNPPLILVSIMKSTGSCYAIQQSKEFIVNILSETQQHVSEQFASQSDNKFSGINYEPNENGLPVLNDCLASLECRVMHMYDGGDHTIFVGDVVKTVVSDRKPLLYFVGKYLTLKD